MPIKENANNNISDNDVYDDNINNYNKDNDDKLIKTCILKFQCFEYVKYLKIVKLKRYLYLKILTAVH